MSAKFLHTFSEENSELRKQIGCMAGIFQMFDRQNFHGGRRFKGRNNKKITSGNSFVNVSNPATNNVSCSPQLVLEKNLSENQRMSMESSRTSFSSSSCSSFSSIDCNKSTLQGPTFQDKSVKNSPKSVNKEPQNLAVKTSYKEEFKQPPMSYIDSPRPIQISKSVDGSYMIGGIDGKKSKSPLDLNESFRVLMKLKEAPWTFEAKEAALNRRFSYDGREISTNFHDSRENGKPASKLKELPRLSLDSRESSMKSSNSIIMKDLNRSRSNKEGNLTCSNAQKEFGSNKSAPSVVAKLMGLEAMPRLSSNLEEQEDIIKNYTSNDVRPPFNSPRSSQKPFFTAKTAIESAPWKKKKKEKLNDSHNKFMQKPETVYSEIGKRLKDIEFHHANKDLRALKQILDAIQAKGLLESKKNEQQNSPKLVPSRSDENLGSPIARKPPPPDSTKGISANRTYDSPIVIMKPAKSLNRFDAAATSVIHLHGLNRIQRIRTGEAMEKKEPCGSKLARDFSPRSSPRINGKSEENSQKSRLRTELGLSNKPQQSSRESNEKTSNSVSPRLQQRKVEVEGRIRSSISSSDSRKHQNMSSSNKQLPELVSPRNKLRRRPTTSRQGDEMSQRSDSNMSSSSQLDMEDTSSKNFTSPEQGGQKNPPVGLDEEASALALAEQPSPISVLDASFYQDDLPSLVAKRSANVSKGNILPNSDNFHEFHKIDSEFNHKKLESIGNLLQKLEELNSTTERPSTTDHIASLCETQSPIHRYISEILLASGLLLKDLSSAPIGLIPIQFHPINPDLFLVLEQTKSSQISKPENMNESTSLHHNLDIEKMHRKLVFDVVNEVLVQKLEISSHSMLLPARKLHGRLPNGQQLLKQLCSEIDQLHGEALKAESPDDDDDDDIIGEEILRQTPLDWNDYRRELPGIVLDIERSIFKDMIDEIVCGESSIFKHKCSRRRRQLFAK